MAGLWVPAAAASPSKPANDDFRNATPITTPRFTDSINTSKAKAAKDDPTDCGPTSNSVWYVLTAQTPMLVATGTLGRSYFPNVAVYTGTQGQLTQVACDAGGASFQAIAGETYHVMVTSPLGGGGTLSFNVIAHVPPPNDDFDNATAITELPFTDTVDTDAASAAPDDPTNCAGTVRSVWYALTPSTDATIVVSTLASDYAADIAVYTGQRGALTPVACGGNQGVSFAATEGTTYLIQVVSGDGGGDLVFNAVGHLPAPNDDFDEATIITSLPFSDTLDSAAATVAPDDPADCAGTNVHTVWYTFTPTADATLTADTSQSSYQAIVCIYTRSRGALSKVADGLQQATVQATAGVSYHFMVADSPFAGEGGTLVFQLQ